MVTGRSRPRVGPGHAPGHPPVTYRVTHRLDAVATRWCCETIPVVARWRADVVEGESEGRLWQCG
jgi:hypothetical protein